MVADSLLSKKAEVCAVAFSGDAVFWADRPGSEERDRER